MINHKIAIVTGASKGIGFNLVQQLITEGSIVACCARDISSLVEFARTNNISEDKLVAVSVDVTDETQVLDFIKSIVDKYKTVDFLFNNVGANPAKGEITDISTDDFDLMYAVNMRAPMLFTREISQYMKLQMSGTIINTHSTCCLFSNAGVGSYTASKSGFDALSKVFRKELRDFNIKVLNVYPGGVDTPFRENDRPDYLRPENVAKIIIQQLLAPAEMFIDDIILRPQVERNF